MGHDIWLPLSFHIVLPKLGLRPFDSQFSFSVYVMSLCSLDHSKCHFGPIEDWLMRVLPKWKYRVRIHLIGFHWKIAISIQNIYLNKIRSFHVIYLICQINLTIVQFQKQNQSGKKSVYRKANKGVLFLSLSLLSSVRYVLGLFLAFRNEFSSHSSAFEEN